jgi:hypothetical protein
MPKSFAAQHPGKTLCKTHPFAEKKARQTVLKKVENKFGG